MKSNAINLSQFPKGIGLNLVNAFFDDLIKDQNQNVDWLEVRPENYLDRGGLGIKRLKELAEIYPMVAHCVTLSLGSPDPIDWDHIKKIKAFLKEFHIPIISDHIGTYSYQHNPYQIILPIPWTQEIALFVAEKARILQDFFEIPLGLENLVYYNFPSKPQMNETDFINLILEKSQCFFLLDINDVYINSQNYNFDAKEWLEKTNLASLGEIHIAGYHQHENGILEGTHAHQISEDTFSLLENLSSKMSLPSILLEWESNYPKFTVILEQLQKITHIWNQSHKKKAS